MNKTINVIFSFQKRYILQTIYCTKRIISFSILEKVNE